MPAPITFSRNSSSITAISTTSASAATWPASACRSWPASCPLPARRTWCAWRNWRSARTSLRSSFAPSAAVPTTTPWPAWEPAGPPSSAPISCTTTSAASTSTRSTAPTRRGKSMRTSASRIPRLSAPASDRFDEVEVEPAKAFEKNRLAEMVAPGRHIEFLLLLPRVGQYRDAHPMRMRALPLLPKRAAAKGHGVRHDLAGLRRDSQVKIRGPNDPVLAADGIDIGVAEREPDAVKFVQFAAPRSGHGKTVLNDGAGEKESRRGREGYPRS